MGAYLKFRLRGEGLLERGLIERALNRVFAISNEPPRGGIFILWWCGDVLPFRDTFLENCCIIIISCRHFMELWVSNQEVLQDYGSSCGETICRILEIIRNMAYFFVIQIFIEYLES